MNCSECTYKYIVHPKYSIIENSKFVICSFKPKLRNHINSEPKWCPIKNDKEESNNGNN